MARRPQSAFVGGASPARRPAISTEIDKRGRGVVPDDLLDQASSKLELPNSNSALADRIHSVLDLAQVTA